MDELPLGKQAFFRTVCLCRITENCRIPAVRGSFHFGIDDFFVLSAIHRRFFTFETMVSRTEVFTDFFIRHIDQHCVVGNALGVVVGQMETLSSAARAGVNGLEALLVDHKMVLIIVGC